MKKILVLFLVLSMLLPLTACPGNTGGGGGGGGDQKEWLDAVGEQNFEGDEVTISCFSLYNYEIYGKEDGDWIQSEVYKRNAALETRFNVKIVPEESLATGQLDLTTHYEKVSLAFTNGSEEFDVLAMFAFKIGNLVKGGNFCDWRTEIPFCSDSINAKNEWWPEEINRDCTINGYQFLAVSDIALTAMEMCYATIFNQELAGTYNIASQITPTRGGTYKTMYDVVDGGDWTIDNLTKVVKDFYQKNPASTVDGKSDEDTYGLAVGFGTDRDAWAFAFDIHYVDNDGVETPSLWNFNTKVSTALEKLQALYYSDGVRSSGDDNYAVRCQFFADGHAIFALLSLEELKSEIMHNMENNLENPYGVLPYAKYDVNQAKYMTGTKDHYTLLAVPTSFLDSDMEHQNAVGAVVEAMSAYNCGSIKNEYYKVIITHNNTHDEDSVRMIDLIMDGRMYDITTYHYVDLSRNGYDNGSLGLFFRYVISDKSVQANSYWQTYQEAWKGKFDDLITVYSTLTGK